MGFDLSVRRLALAALIGGMLSPGMAMAQGGPTMVAVDPVVVEPLTQTTPVLGRLVSRQRGVVAALTNGPVREITVDVGDRVSAGDVILQIAAERIDQSRNLQAAEVTVARAKVDTARAGHGLAQQELARLERLRSSAAFSQARYDDQVKQVATKLSELAEAEAAVASAVADLRLAEIDLDRSTVRAPYDGVVVERHTERGAYLSTGDSIVTMINDQDLEVAADVPSNRISGLATGREVKMTLGDGRAFDGFVRAVVPEENALTRTRAVRFSLALDQIASQEGAPFAANQTVTVLVPVGEASDVVTVHKDAVMPRGRSNNVFVAVDGKAEMRSVQLGDSVGNRFVVLRGLQAGEQTVVRGNERLRPGQAIGIAGQPPTAGADAQAKSENGKAS